MRTISCAVMLALLASACDSPDTPLAPSRVQCDSMEGLANDYVAEPYDPNAPIIEAMPGPPVEATEAAGFCAD